MLLNLGLVCIFLFVAGKAAWKSLSERLAERRAAKAKEEPAPLANRRQGLMAFLRRRLSAKPALSGQSGAAAGGDEELEAGRRTSYSTAAPGRVSLALHRAETEGAARGPSEPAHE